MTQSRNIAPGPRGMLNFLETPYLVHWKTLLQYIKLTSATRMMIQLQHFVSCVSMGLAVRYEG